VLENLPPKHYIPIRQVQRFLDSCKGCYMYEHAVECKYVDKFLAELCPCKECLVKIMCEESCEKFVEIDKVQQGSAHGQ
jgi:hypothetical protein